MLGIFKGNLICILYFYVESFTGNREGFCFHNKKTTQKVTNQIVNVSSSCGVNITFYKT